MRLWHFWELFKLVVHPHAIDIDKEKAQHFGNASGLNTQIAKVFFWEVLYVMRFILVLAEISIHFFGLVRKDAKFEGGSIIGLPFKKSRTPWLTLNNDITNAWMTLVKYLVSCPTLSRCCLRSKPTFRSLYSVLVRSQEEGYQTLFILTDII